MATNAVQAGDTSTDTKYRISLTDIRGVGGATVRKLETAGIESIEETHLLRRRTSPSYNQLKDMGVGEDTLEHLRAVGKAVHYSGSDRVEAKHLTHADAQGELPSTFVSLLADAEKDADADQQTLGDVDSFDPDADQLAVAVEAIQDEYDGGYGDQISFEADLGRHIHEVDRFTPDDHKLPTGLIQSLLRYEHDAERFAAQGDYEPAYGSLLISFANTLSE